MSCERCGGARLLFDEWIGPSPASPYPDPCPVCSPDLSDRDKQVIRHEYLMEHADLPRVKEILSRMAVLRGPQLRLVVHYPYTRGVENMDNKTMRDADMVIGYGNIVVKDRQGAVPYTLSDNELRRIRDEAGEFRTMER